MKYYEHFSEVDRHTEKAMAPHSSTLAWEIPWTEEPGRLQSVGLQKRHNSLNSDNNKEFRVSGS